MTMKSFYGKLSTPLLKARLASLEQDIAAGKATPTATQQVVVIKSVLRKR
jgi:hypothetical protein